MAFYTPGNEPDDLKKKLSSFFARIDGYYPDKKIVRLHNDHKKLGERLTSLYRELGYDSGKEMLEAYGYEVELQKRTVSEKNTAENIQKRKEVLLEDLKSCFSGRKLRFISDLDREVPGIQTEIRSLGISKSELIEAGVLYVPAPKKETARQVRPHRKQVLPPKEWAIDRPHYERALILGLDAQLSRRYKHFVERELYGYNAKEYYRMRELYEPGGEIQEAMTELRSLMSVIDSVSDFEKVDLNDLSSDQAEKLERICHVLGHETIGRLLTAYGYTLIGDDDPKPVDQVIP